MAEATNGTSGTSGVTVTVTGPAFTWCGMPVITSDGMPLGEVECIAPGEDLAEAERRAWDRKRRRLIRRVK